MISHTMSPREKKALEIAENAELYKVCCGCSSIVTKATVICSNCHAYRFQEKQELVVKKALELGKREQQSVTSEDLK